MLCMSLESLQDEFSKIWLTGDLWPVDKKFASVFLGVKCKENIPVSISCKMLAHLSIYMAFFTICQSQDFLYLLPG